MPGRPILPALDGLQGSLAVTRLTLHPTADFPPSCGKLFTTHSAVLGSFHWAGRTAFKMREPASFVNIFPALSRSEFSSDRRFMIFTTEKAASATTDLRITS